MKSKQSKKNPLHSRYTLTQALERDLLDIEAARQAVQRTSLAPRVADETRRKARVRSAHYTTRIEGNRLTLTEAEEIILHGQRFLGREREVRELQNTYRALRQVELWAEQQTPVTGDLIHELHAFIENGAHTKSSPYRDGQNVIRNAATGALVYRPPEAAAVPGLTSALVAWIAQAEREELPPPVIAGLAHYQFVVIQPFFKSNGRTARALATLILYRRGYDLWWFGSLEEIYAQDLDAYYDALQTHPHHEDYEERAKADLTGWLEYFLRGMADVFRRAAAEAPTPAESPGKAEPERKPKARRKPESQREPKSQRKPKSRSEPEPSELRDLDPRARAVLELFRRQETLAAADVAGALDISARTARDLLAKWTDAGWLEIVDPARRSRRYRLPAEYRRVVGEVTVEA